MIADWKIKFNILVIQNYKYFLTYVFQLVVFPDACYIKFTTAGIVLFWRCNHNNSPRETTQYKCISKQLKLKYFLLVLVVLAFPKCDNCIFCTLYFWTDCREARYPGVQVLRCDPFYHCFKILRWMNECCKSH